MSRFPINSALESAIVASADEDTPRLAYADWLDENGDPDRAEFIRVQCRLANLSPDAPDWCDLIERQEELLARLKSRFPTNEIDKAERFYFGTDIVGHQEEPYRRGFPYFMACQTNGDEWSPKEVSRVVKVLTRLVSTTTIRGFYPYYIPVEHLRSLLAAPVMSELRGLSLTPFSLAADSEEEYTSFYRLLATSPAMTRIEQLYLFGGTFADGVNALANATTLDEVRRLEVQSFTAPRKSLERLVAAPWFRRLHHFRCALDSPSVAIPMATGLGRLPDLHTLHLPILHKDALRPLAKGKFPALARLEYHGAVDPKSMGILARARFPSLAVFQATLGGMKNEAFLTLLKAKWFERLRVLAVSENQLGDKSLTALAQHPAALTLRVLRLGDNSFGRAGLAAIARPGVFPALSSLDLGSTFKRKANMAEVTAFVAALQLPSLRHLDLSGWPLGDTGAMALAALPAYAGLTRLNLTNCKIGDAGARALFTSPHLQGLIELHIGYNLIVNATDALTDPAVLPQLSECWLSANPIPAKSVGRIKRKGLYLMK